MNQQETNSPGNQLTGSGDEPAATPAETRAELLERAGRKFTPLNKLFVQARPGSDPRHGPLNEFVHNRDKRGLLALLFIIAVTSSGDRDGWSTSLPLAVWARALGTTVDANGSAATAAVSKILTRLENRNLIQRERHGRERRVRVTLLREDGSGAPYTRPGKNNDDRFLQVSHAFWLDGWHDRLTLPALAMLLVALHEKPNFRLPSQRVPEWYGWSADTAERGFCELEQHGLIVKTSRLIKAPLSPSGLTRVNEYRLTGPLVPPAKRTTAKKKPRAGKGRGSSAPSQPRQKAVGR